MIEKRSAPRRISSLPADLRFAGVKDPVPGIVKNISEQGALIEVLSSDEFPNRVVLSIWDSNIVHLCEVIRRTPHCLGLRFIA